jgi:tetratricopeptide (TPR) repeat protein
MKNKINHQESDLLLQKADEKTTIHFNDKELAKLLYKKEEYNKALFLYTKILLSDNKNHIILLNRSLVYIKLNTFKNAIDDIIQSIILKSNWSKSWGILGACLFSLNKYSDALIAYKKAYQLELLNENIQTNIYLNMINEILNIQNNEDNITEEED